VTRTITGLHPYTLQMKRVQPRTGVSVALSAVIGFVALLAPSGQAVTTAQPTNLFRTGRTLVIAHGGGDGLFPENTMLAYQRSTALGSEVIDLDVQLTGDGTLIAFHDPTLDRTTNGTGLVRNKTYAQIRLLDAGYRFNKGGKYPFRSKGVRVPTLKAVLEKFPTKLATLDLKDQRISVVKPVCDLVLGLQRTESIYIGVDTNEQVLEFRRVCPQLHTSGTSEERQAMRAARESGDTSYRTKQLVSQPRYLSDDGTKRVTAETLAFSHSLNIAVLTWVIDDPQVMRELIELGVDGIYTRRPDLLVSVLKASTTSR
jgi:glycerophosphoryl diester phosphodiesterase